MRLKYQLFVAMLVASALLILLMYVISSWSFSRGLLSYVNQGAEQRARALLVELESEYAERRSWQWARGASVEWRRLTSRVDQRGAAGALPGKRRPKYVLADASRQIIAGSSRVDPATRWLDIEYDASVVGYLGYRQLARLNTELDRAFEAQQQNSFAYAALAMVLLSAVLAIPMASYLLKPLLRIGVAVEYIGQGDYTHKLKSSRRDELGVLATDINQLATTLERNRTARQRWIAEISHELRTPVAVLRSELEAMQDGVRDITATAIESLHVEVISLNRLIDDLHTLALSDIGALDYKREPLNPERLIQEFLDNNAAGFTDASLTLQTDLSGDAGLIEGDSQRLLQLFSNLYQNSVRYTDAGGTVRVQCECLSGQQVRIVWSDSAPGVPPQSLPNLFDPLYRVEKSRNRASGGAGLGLSIASRIVQAHGGTICAQDSPLGGLEIDIRLPLAHAV